MLFEYDPVKSDANKAKHGIDFEAAKALWDDPYLIEIPSRVSGPEPRRLAIGNLAGQCWAAVITDRGQAVRIISVRRARKEEVALYVQANFH